MTFYMEGNRIGVARTDLFRVHPSTFWKPVNIALNANFNFKAALNGAHGHHTGTLDRPLPMYLSYVDGEKRQASSFGKAT